MGEYTLKYGDSKINVQVPDELMNGEMIAPSSPPRKMNDSEIMDEIRKALVTPHACEPLATAAAGKKVAVLVNDEFRAGFQQQLLNVAMEELAKASPSKIVVLCATGTHPPEFYAKNIRVWAFEAAEKAGVSINFVGHDCDDPKLVDMGTTPMGTPVAMEPDVLAADVIVFLHESKVHYMNGYSLPDKMALPGMSARKTVEVNHKRALDADHAIGGNSPHHSDPKRQTNPFGEDARDARRMAERLGLDGSGKVVPVEKLSFTIDMISDTAYVHQVFAGETESVIKRMLPVIDELTAFAVTRADCVVVSPGGPPACNALYGVQNCFDLAIKGAIKKGGEALIIAPCIGRDDLPYEVSGIAPNERSKVLFWDNLLRLLQQDVADAEKWIADNFKLYLWKTDRVLKLVKRDQIKLYLYSDIDQEKLEGSPFTPVTDPQAWIDERVQKGLRFNVIDSGNKVLTIGK